VTRTGRDDFSKVIIEALAKRAAHRCSNPSCRRPTSGPGLEQSSAINVGVAAHIAAASPGGPRYDAAQTKEKRGSITNGIWLCQTCAKLVDADASAYSTETLHRWKTQHEAWISTIINGEWTEPYNKQFSGEHTILMCVMETRDSTRSPMGDQAMMTGLFDDPAANIDSLRYSETLPIEIDVDDPNGSNWTVDTSTLNRRAITGLWEGRWSRHNEECVAGVWHKGRGTISQSREWVQIDFHDDHSPYIIIARLQKNRLIGRYINCAITTDCYPWVGFIRSNNRIDGHWPYGRWDFKR
jgi:hypothetical protein